MSRPFPFRMSVSVRAEVLRSTGEVLRERDVGKEVQRRARSGGGVEGNVSVLSFYYLGRDLNFFMAVRCV